MKIEKQIETINAMIREKGEQIFVNATPDMNDLQNEMASFLDSIKNLPVPQAMEYGKLVQVWTEEIKTMSDKLHQTKSEIQAEINRAQAQGRATAAYTAATRKNGE